MNAKLRRVEQRMKRGVAWRHMKAEYWRGYKRYIPPNYRRLRNPRLHGPPYGWLLKRK